MIRLRWILVLMSLLALLAAGCGDEGEDGGGGDAGGAEAAPEPRAEGDVTWCIGKDTSGAFGTVVDSFNKANPNANVKLLQLPEAADEQRRILVLHVALGDARQRDRRWH